jgi:hypothetical protein
MMNNYGEQTKIKYVIEALQAGDSPVFVTRIAVYVLSLEHFDNGFFLYTKFVDNQPVHTVRVLITFAETLGELIRRGESLGYKLPSPIIDNIPT